MFDYNSKRWRRKAEYIKRKYGYLCQESLRYGKRVEAEMVHHIYPVDEYPEYAYADWNLLPLSNKQHNRMHIRETRELTPLGKAWQRRTPLPSPSPTSQKGERGEGVLYIKDEI